MQRLQFVPVLLLVVACGSGGHGTSDAGTPNATPDAGTPDAGASDAGTQDASAGVTATQPPTWDAWFDEVLTWDPSTGHATFAVNGAAPISGNCHAATDPIRIGFSPYGWYTGHEQRVDQVAVEWLPAAD